MEARSDVTLVWFRQDLRLRDNPALAAAVSRGGPVIPVFLWAPDEEGGWPPGAASRWWLHGSLTALAADLEKRGSRLVIRRGPTLAALQCLIAETGATAVYWNRRYEPAAILRDRDVKARLREQGIEVESFNGSLLFEPWTVKPYKVFTAFWKACLAQPLPPASTEPKRLAPPASWPKSIAVSMLELEPRIDWAAGLRESWRPGEAGAQKQLRRFCDQAIEDYAEGRDKPAEPGTSRLSPHLHWGEISPGALWRAASERKSEAWLRQLAWREFAYHLLYHFPESPSAPLRPEFTRFPWRNDRRALQAWQHGRTGYPLVDAGMHELWHTGWMHNRVRMVVASFLVKHLLIHWQEGAAWFWDTLVDADLANNTLGWQWVAGCGADAAPYFRIFNPMLQAEKFDPAGEYVRRWAPDDHEPIVDHAKARQRALEAFRTIREN